MKNSQIPTRMGIMAVLAAAWLSFFCGPSLGADSVTGRVTSAILLQERINLTVADKAVIDLGKRDGLIKGDILTVTPGADLGLTNPIAECAIVSLVNEESSICQIIKARVEVQRGNFVSIDRFVPADEKFHSLYYNLMMRTVGPYEPHKKIHVYVHEIFDQQNSVTALGKRIKNGIEATFAQKKRITLHKNLEAQDFIFYPTSYRDTAITLNQAMVRSQVDVVISGFYTLEKGNLIVTLYRFDRRFGDEGVSFRSTLTSLADLSEAGEIIEPFRPIRKKEYVAARVSVKTRQVVPDRDEVSDIIAYESGGDVFKVNMLRRTGFTVISPFEVAVRLDGMKLNFGGKDDIIIPAVEKGIHRVTASFRRGYYGSNRNSLLYGSTRDVEKEIVVNIEKDGDVTMEILCDPSFDRESIDFRIFKQSEKTRLLLKPIHNLDSGRTVEYFKD